MSRVLGVVGRSIKVHIHDVVDNDILYMTGDENDSIIERVERDGDKVRFHYKVNPHEYAPVRCSLWMNPIFGPWVFIHDLKNERAEF